MRLEADRDRRFTAFVTEVEPRLRYALGAAMGTELGREATSEALAYAWEHWTRIEPMDNPAGYLYRVGRSRGRRRRKVAPRFAPVASDRLPHVEPGLPDAMRKLTEKQRVAVVLVHGFGWTRPEVSELLGISVSAVNAHTSRGLAKLRNELGVVVHE